MAHRAKTPHKGGKHDSSPAVRVMDDADMLKREIELHAYPRYCERGCTAGADVDDWVAAEREVLAAHGSRLRSTGNSNPTDHGGE